MQMQLILDYVQSSATLKFALRAVHEGLLMRNAAVALLTAIVLAGSIAAQEQLSPTKIGSGATSLSISSSLPIERIGRDDLLGVTVYDSPELTRLVRVNSSGEIRLPMLQQPIQVSGLYPSELEDAIRGALVDEQILVDPVVTISVVEYRSRPINVVGAVRTPSTFQAAGTTTLLDAISQAGGLTDNAGAEILVSRQQVGADGKSTSLVQRVPVHGLFDAVDPSLNLKLHGGEIIRVPEAGRVYVVGNVNRPGVFPITDGSETSVLKVLALSGGLEHYTQHIAYIYRSEGSGSAKKEIPIQLKKIMDRKSSDVALLGNDILYIPEATGRKTTLTALDRMAIVGAGLGTTLLYISR